MDSSGFGPVERERGCLEVAVFLVEILDVGFSLFALELFSVSWMVVGERTVFLVELPVGVAFSSEVGRRPLLLNDRDNILPLEDCFLVCPSVVSSLSCGRRTLRLTGLLFTHTDLANNLRSVLGLLAVVASVLVVSSPFLGRESDRVNFSPDSFD